MSTSSMLTSWVRDWGDQLQEQPALERQPLATAEPARAARRSAVVADIGNEKAAEDMRLLVLEKEINHLREENELIRRLLDEMLDKRPPP